MSMASCTSPRVSDSGLPISRVMSRARSSLRFTRVSAARYNISARRGAGNSRHFLNAAFAASTASFTSSCVEDGKIPTSSPVFAGLRFSNVLPRRAATHSPLMKFLWLLETALVVMSPPAVIRGFLINKVGRSCKHHRGGTFPAWQFNVAEGQEAVKQAGWIAVCPLSHDLCQFPVVEDAASRTSPSLRGSRKTIIRRNENRSANLKVENGKHEIGPAIQQNNMAANHNVLAVRRWRRQLPFQFHGQWLDAFLQTWRQGASFGELPFQSRWQSVFLGQPRGKRVLVVVVPGAHSVSVMIAERVRGSIIIVTLVFLTVTFSMTVAIALRESEGTRKR